MFRAGLVPIIRILLTASQHKRMTHTNCCMYRVVSPDDEQYACSKHVEVNFLNKWKVNSASYWFLLYGYIPQCTENRTLNLVHP